MDCCNYVPYGQHHLPYGHHHAPPPHHQPYYAAYHEPVRDYYAPREYYAPPPPPAAYDCYGSGRYACTSPYYAPPSPVHCGTWGHPSPLDVDPFHSEYVYNPKEARIRKAMRDALRDRAIGGAGAAALPRPGARRPAPPWLGAPAPPQAPVAHQPSPHDELIMPGSTAGIPPRLAASPVGAGRFPLPPGPPVGPYGPAHYGGRLEPPLITSADSADYMNQPNPLAQLQQQTEMWSSYPDMTPRSTSASFMMHDNVPTPPHYPPHPHHHHHQSPLPGEMPPLAPPTPHPAHLPLSLPLTPPHSNENVPPDGVVLSAEGDGPCGVGERFDRAGEEPAGVGVQPLAESGNQAPHGAEFLNVYAPDRLALLGEGRCGQEGKMKKTPSDPSILKGKRTPNMTYYLPLSCTNFSASPDLFTNNAEYHRKYIAKYFQGMPEYEILNIMSEDGLNFPYATVLPRYHHNFNIRRGN